MLTTIQAFGIGCLSRGPVGFVVGVLAFEVVVADQYLQVRHLWLLAVAEQVDVPA